MAKVKSKGKKKAKGIDDALAAGVQPTVIAGEDAKVAVEEIAVAAKEADPQLQNGSGDQVQIHLAPGNESTIANQARNALAGDDCLFQREGAVVHVVHPNQEEESRPEPKAYPEPRRRMQVTWPRSLTRLRDAPLAFVRERISARCCLFDVVKRGDQERLVLKNTPEWLPAMVLANPGPIRRLKGILPGPTLDEEGRLVNVAGYDSATQWYLADPLAGFTIPDKPSREDAIAAAAILADLVQDFPFATKADKARWLCLLLTACCRHLIERTPLGLVMANKAGAGKSRLVELISIIAHGLDAPVLMTWPDGADHLGERQEIRKRLVNLSHVGASLVVIDNLPRGSNFGSPELDAFISGNALNDRKLGSNTSDLAGGPNRCLLLATGNAITPYGDTADRTLKVEMTTSDANPRSRPPESFQIPNLLAHTRANRSRYLGAALTIWKAWFCADMPQPAGDPWGTFEDFVSKVVAMVRWIGWPDPIADRARQAYETDSESQTLKALLSLWGPALGEEPVTCSQILSVITGSDLFSPADRPEREAFAEAVLAFGNWSRRRPPTIQALGKKLGSYSKCTVEAEAENGTVLLCLVSDYDRRAKAHVYCVEVASSQDRAGGPAAGSAGSAGSRQSVGGKRNGRAHTNGREDFPFGANAYEEGM